MSVKIVDNTNQVIADKRLGANRFLGEVVRQIEIEATPKTPKKDGDLRNIRKQVLGLNAQMVWDVPYAKYQERGMRADGTRVVRNYTTPGTGSRFAETAVKAVVARTDKIVKATGGL